MGLILQLPLGHNVSQINLFLGEIVLEQHLLRSLRPFLGALRGGSVYDKHTFPPHPTLTACRVKLLRDAQLFP